MSWEYNGYFWVKQTEQAIARIYDHSDGGYSWEVELTGQRWLALHDWIDWRYCENGTWKSASHSWWKENTSKQFCDLLLAGEITVRRRDIPDPRMDGYYFDFDPIKVVRRVIPNYDHSGLFRSSVLMWDFGHPTKMDHWRNSVLLKVEQVQVTE